MEELALRPILQRWEQDDDYWFDQSPGRRLRCFARLLGVTNGGISVGSALLIPGQPDGRITYGDLLDWCSEAARESFEGFTIGSSGNVPRLDAMPKASYSSTYYMHSGLQDLDDEVIEDICEACLTLDNPAAYYPGVEDGIDPVTDEHVRLVTWGMQRQLDKDRRSGTPQRWGVPVEMPDIGTRPAFPLADLAWPVQRALAERRRLRFQQWGITHEVWKRGTWSLWDVPEDWDYVPRRALAGRGRGA